MSVHSKKHPHVHGEDFRLMILMRLPLETPPRAWGRLQKGLSRNLHAGNTPTCMGKTFRAKKKNTSNRKHPHVHGEDYAINTGPSARDRNTPTCMGKTLGLCLRCYCAEKHPHVHGED